MTGSLTPSAECYPLRHIRPLFSRDPLHTEERRKEWFHFSFGLSMPRDGTMAGRQRELQDPPEAEALVPCHCCLSSWLSAHSQAARMQMVRISSFPPGRWEREDTLFHFRFLVVCHVKILSHLQMLSNN